jgi:hypothetical protein
MALRESITGKAETIITFEDATSGLPAYCSRDDELVHSESITALPEARWERQ